MATSSVSSAQLSCEVGLCRVVSNMTFPPPPAEAAPQHHSLPWEGENCVVVPTGSAARGASGSDTMLKGKRSSDKSP